MEPTQKTEAEAVAEIVEKQHFYGELGVMEVNELGALVFPDKTITSLEKYHAQPSRKRAVVKLTEPTSFMDYIKDQAGESCLITASEETHSFSAIIDYHGKGESGSPDWGEHQATLRLDQTAEWKRWIANNRQPIPQIKFAEFIEDNLPDVIKPEGAALLDLVQNLQGTRKVQFKSSQRLSDGQQKVIYDESIETAGACQSKRTGEMKIPQEIVIKISPFVGVSAIAIPLRLRIRIGDGGDIAFIYLFPKPEEIQRAAWQAIRAEITKSTGRKVLLGSAFVPAL